MSNLPKTIKIGHFTYKVEYEDANFDERLQVGKQRITSTLDLQNWAIVISDTEPEEVQRTALLVSTLELIDKYTSTDLSKQDLIAIAFHLYGVLKANPDLLPRGSDG